MIKNGYVMCSLYFILGLISVIIVFNIVNVFAASTILLLTIVGTIGLTWTCYLAKK